MKITYEKNGDYLIPNIIPNQEPDQPLTKYGKMRMDFLEKNHKGIFTAFLLSGKLKKHCLQIQEQAEERVDVLVEQMAKAEGVNEELKATDQMKWVSLMNNIKYSAEEIVQKELIYTLS